ncbi:excalibur calcium-binding domain-containing protein [Lysobacter sp. CA196]|uniref:excalibur calcium-binding domain-containing protein n=1 Tax=Lysobacter sp. CA196 TaxID=3455606 RepID=UPI003F8D4EB2
MHAHSIALGAALVLSATSPAWAHGGGLNAEGCHNDRKHGDYHCHRGPAAGGGNLRPAAPRTPGRAPSWADDGGAYANCSAARAAGAAPVRRGDPGYGRHLDRDGDGVACE